MTKGATCDSGLTPLLQLGVGKQLGKLEWGLQEKDIGDDFYYPDNLSSGIVDRKKNSQMIMLAIQVLSKSFVWMEERRRGGWWGMGGRGKGSETPGPRHNGTVVGLEEDQFRDNDLSGPAFICEMK